MSSYSSSDRYSSSYRSSSGRSGGGRYDDRGGRYDDRGSRDHHRSRYGDRRRRRYEDDRDRRKKRSRGESGESQSSSSNKKSKNGVQGGEKGLQQQQEVDEVERRILEKLKKRKEEVDHKKILAEMISDEDEEESEDEEDEAERARREREERRKRILAKHKKSKQQTVKKTNITTTTKTKTEANEKETKSTEETSLDIFSLATMKAPITDVVEAAAAKQKAKVTVTTIQDNDTLADNWDDDEGYYRTTIGEMLGDRYRVARYGGQGVFSTVLICTNENDEKKTEVAIKIIRANETMKKASEKELHILKTIAKHDHPGRRFNIELLEQFFHRNHTCLVFEPLSMNLRMLLKKLAAGVGISIVAVQRFATQIFLALRQLRVLNIVHADLKPDNILISKNHQTIKVCDFGSAFYLDDPENAPTPYLVSRFYRAPEICLGLAYDTKIDIWSAGCCLYEMFTSKVLFQGKNNNLMLDKFMELKGPFPRKMIRRHFKSFELMQRAPHFDTDFTFRKHAVDPVTKADTVKLVTYTKNTQDLGHMMSKHIGNNSNTKLVFQLRDLLERCFLLDPSKRISAKEALKHPFIEVNTTNK